MKQTHYYDGTKLLSLMDENGNKPEIYICTSNRTAGKTTYFNRMAVNGFLKKRRKFALLYRFNYELDDVCDKFFKDINGLFFNKYSMHSERRANGIYHELFMDYPDNTKEHPHSCSCGYAITLNSADQLKKYSHIFSDTDLIIFDEFQSETNHYCSNEVQKFLSIHTSIARGQSLQSRYVPCILIGNPVSTINPYYIALGISNRLQKNTHFLRGNGWVLEQGYNESASNALNQSQFMRAFSGSQYSQYVTDGSYLNDSDSFICNMPENGYYMATIKYDGRYYSIKEYINDGVIYVSDSYDLKFPKRIAIDLPDHSLNFVMLDSNNEFVSKMKTFFNLGCIRFKNQLCKNAFLALIGYNVLK